LISKEIDTFHGIPMSPNCPMMAVPLAKEIASSIKSEIKCVYHLYALHKLSENKRFQVSQPPPKN
jgi:hypothetical protein